MNEGGFAGFLGPAKIITPIVHEGRQQIARCEDLVETVRRVIVEFGLREEIVRHAFANPIGSRLSQFDEGFRKLVAPLLEFLLVGLTADVRIPQRDLPFSAAVEDAEERVVVRCGNGIILVIVTTRTTDGERHGATGHDIDAVVNDVALHPEKAAAQREETHRSFVARLAVLDLVGGQLQQQETIVGHVFVQRLHHPVAIGPGMGPEAFLPAVDITLGVRIARDVQPMPAPMLAVMRRIQKSIDATFVGLRIAVVCKCFDLVKARRQPGERVMQTPNQLRPIGWWGLLQTCATQAVQNKRINRICRFHTRQGGFAYRLKGPVRIR